VKQGTVLGPDLCSCSTAELADENSGGVSVGSFTIGSILYVDDMNLMNNTSEDTMKSHEMATNFKRRKRIGFSYDKCLIMVVNKKAADPIPNLDIDGKPMKSTKCIKVLGDMFNDKGNNKDLIADRLKRGTSCTVNSISLCNELSLGTYTVLTLLTLYNAVFLSAVLFNSQAWSNLKKSEFEQLAILQQKFLKRTVKAPSSSPCAATLLEFGALPIKCEIHIKQLNFLHHILLLDSDDPVAKMYIELKRFPYEMNWVNDVADLLKLYKLVETEDEIRLLSKRKWKKLVKQRVVESAFKALSQEASEMTKTSSLKYKKLHTQNSIIL
jgi:hypothetical protein